jgi:predicted transglutaminase-like cysteine proteinase
MREGKALPSGFKEIVIKDLDGEAFPDLVKNETDRWAKEFGAISQKNHMKSKVPLFCTFIPGGISTNEVRELRSLEKDKHIGPIITICSGTTLLSPDEYIKELKRVNQRVNDDISTINVAGEQEGDALLDEQI